MLALAHTFRTAGSPVPTFSTLQTCT